MSRNRQSKRNIQFPLTVRVAQKLAANPAVKISSLMEAVGLCRMGSDRFDRPTLQKKLAQMAQVNPTELINAVEYDEYDYDGAEDFDYEDLEEENQEAGADSPSAEARPADENREEGESRPKDTDEVAPQSADPSEESDRHGGDGNSGECAAPAQTDPQETTEAQSQAASAKSGGNEQGSGVPSGLPAEGSDRDAGGKESGSETGGNPTSEGDRPSEQSQSSDRQLGASPSTALGKGERPDGNYAPPPSGDQPRDAGAQESGDSQTPDVSDAPEQSGEGDRAKTELGDDSRSSNGDSEESGFDTGEEAIENGVGEDVPQESESLEGNQPGDDCPTHQKKWGKKFGKAEKSQLSASANENHGGVTAELKRIGVDAKLLKLCRQRLAALAGESSQDYSPRRDYAEFCVRLKTYRNPAPARREEQGRPVILIMADVSGSCASFSGQSVAVAKAASSLGVPGADVLVLSHSNGYPCELEHNGRTLRIDSIGSQSGYEHAHENESWYNALTEKFQIQAVIALGDWDAADDYARLAQHPTVERFIWLDNAYSSSRGTVRDRSKWAIAQISDRGYAKPALIRHKLAYRDGCKDAIAFINNIK